MSALRVIPGSADLVRFLAARMSPQQHAVLAPDADASLRSLESDVQNAARSWCAIDDGGPVLLLAATPLGDVSTATGGVSAAKLWYIAADDVALRHKRGCVRLWRRAVAEMTVEFGTIVVDVPPYVAPVRRMTRYGFEASAPFDQGEGTVICRCAVWPGRARGMFRPYLPPSPAA